MKNKLCILIITSIIILLPVTSRAASSLLPFRLEHYIPAMKKTIRIELNKEDSGNIEISYTAFQNGESKVSKKEFSPVIIKELFKKLQSNQDPNPEKWSSDPDCLINERWRLEFGSSKKEICTNKIRTDKIEKFQASIELLLRQ